jgi:ATP-dependent DNA helicase 2 subunit 2
LVSGYQYGKDLVPINKTMEFATKIIEEKCFKLLGFIGKEKVPRQVFMSNIDIVIPSENIASKKLFSAFIYSMLTLNRYAIARYIPRNLKNGVSPKLMLLIPHRSAKGECFYMTQLPTAEDIRDYQFTSLKESTTQQQELIENLIDQMNLCEMTDSKGDTYEALKPKNTFNPYNQYLFQTIFHRAFKENDETPPLNPQIS